MGFKELENAYISVCMAEQALWAIDLLSGVKPTADSYGYSEFIASGIDKAFEREVHALSI